MQSTVPLRALFVAVSLALHLGAFLALGANRASPHGPTSPGKLLAVRLIPSEELDAAADADRSAEHIAALAAALLQLPSARSDRTHVPVTPNDLRLKSDAEQDTGPRNRRVTVSMPRDSSSVENASKEANAREVARLDPSRYTPVGQLSVRPAPIGNVAVPYPAGEARREIVTLKLTLYIEEDGSVAGIETDASDLPAAFHDAAKRAFLRARFKPGRLGERPVPTRMRIEVVFDPDDGQAMRRLQARQN